MQAIKDSLHRHYYTGWRSPTHYTPQGYDTHLQNQLRGRVESDRRMIVPWLDHARPLEGSRILEIGCGTGSSTVTLAEQGAHVLGIDLDPDALLVARDRCDTYRVEAEFLAINAAAIARTLQDRPFDVIIFFASLEHLTIAERLTALRDAWAMLPGGGLLVIVETPNRLWYYDGHTALLPFFHWLPDELAFHFSRFSPRENFRELYREMTPEATEHFLRQGRGVSFHEFDLAIRPGLRVVSSLSTFHGLRYKPQRSLFERRYKTLLRRIYPQVHEGFCEDSLFLIIQKD
jgi:2-polyprenyl-3-methyl-5-hydroxy-6-metoxy-1,4-benzoquinol methylase